MSTPEPEACALCAGGPVVGAVPVRLTHDGEREMLDADGRPFDVQIPVCAHCLVGLEP